MRVWGGIQSQCKNAEKRVFLSGSAEGALPAAENFQLEQESRMTLCRDSLSTGRRRAAEHWKRELGGSAVAVGQVNIRSWDWIMLRQLRRLPTGGAQS